MSELIKETASMSFTYQGGSEVDALTVAKTIESLVEITTSISEKEYPDAKISLSIHGTKEGCLEILFIALAQYIPTLLTPANVTMVKDIIQGMVGIFQVKQFLKGKKPEKVVNEGSAIKVTSEDGNTIEVPASSGVYFVNCSLDASVNRIFDNVKEKPSISGLKISSEVAPSMEISSNEFEDCATPIDVAQNEEEERIAERKNEILYVRQPDFSGKAQWGFVADKNIHADVQDEDFLNKIETGEISLRSRTYIVADMSVRVPWVNGEPNPVNPKYTITKVHSIHYPDDEQIEL